MCACGGTQGKSHTDPILEDPAELGGVDPLILDLLSHIHPDEHERVGGGGWGWEPEEPEEPEEAERHGGCSHGFRAVWWYLASTLLAASTPFESPDSSKYLKNVFCLPGSERGAVLPRVEGLG